MGFVGFIIFIIIILIIVLGWNETVQIVEFTIDKLFEILNAILLRISI